jgi:hypothetical protein
MAKGRAISTESYKIIDKLLTTTELMVSVIAMRAKVSQPVVYERMRKLGLVTVSTDLLYEISIREKAVSA